MNRKHVLGLAVVILFYMLTAGCISIEQEVFLNPDGSGEFILHLSVPDLPEEMKSTAKGPGGKGGDLTKNIEEMKQELTTKLPPTVKVKEVKQAHQNGALGYYIVFQFKDLKDMTAVLANFGKESFKDSELKNRPEWSINLKKVASKWSYSSSFYMSLDDDKNPQKTDAGKKSEAPVQIEMAGEDLSKQLLPLFLSTVKLRFVLHAPGPILDSNADIVMHGDTAVWNCSFVAFMKEKKPIRMRASF